MKIDYRWIGVMLLALAVGHWSGRVFDQQVSANTSSGLLSLDEDQAGSQANRGDRTRLRNRTQGGQRKNSRHQELQRILKDFRFSGSGVPFGGDGIGAHPEHPAWPHLCAWVMNASRADFPLIMETEELKNGELPDSNVMRLLLQRWVELDPDSAITWVRSLQERACEETVLDTEMFLVQQAAWHYPQWAAEKLSKLHQRIEEYNSAFDPEQIDDPFGDSGLSMDFDRFFWRLAQLPPAERSAIVQGLGSDVLEEGIEGWTRGLIAHGGLQDFLNMYEQSIGSDLMHQLNRGFLYLANEDWRKAREFTERNQTAELDEFVWYRWTQENSNEADKWFIERAPDDKSREVRIAKVADKFHDIDEQTAWIDRMESQGEPVGKALVELAMNMKRDEQFQQAMEIISRVPAKEQPHLRQQVYQSITKKCWFTTIGNNGANYYIPDERHADFAAGHPEYWDYINGNNSKAVKRMRKIIDSLESNFHRSDSSPGGN